jgi:aldehyde:ferredoxin oxidoreductase
LSTNVKFIHEIQGEKILTHECWNKQILWVDLTNKTTKVEPLEESVYEQWIGGRGLATYLVYKYLKPGIDPLSPDNILAFATGPLQGLPAPSVGKFAIVSKSPLTGLYFDTYCGGAFGREFKKAGYDAVLVKGRAAKPTVLVIDDDKIEFRDAGDIWGKGIYKSTEKLEKELGKDVSVFTIGPAGENMVKVATACCEIAHQTGRGGTGAILGSKNLKAIVTHGTGSIGASDIKTMRTINSTISKGWKTVEGQDAYKRHGTAMLPAVSNSLGQLPSFNFRSGFFEDIEKLDPEILKQWDVGVHKSCPHCVMRCTHSFKTENPFESGSEVETAMEYESIGMMGPNCGISDFQTLIKMNYACDDLGLDTISSGVIIGFAMEAFEKGILTESDIGFSLAFGDGEAAIKLLRMIAYKEGIGKVLSQGVRAASKEIGKGSEAFAVHVKGLEVPAWDPRGRKGMGLSYATSAIGGSHLRGWPATTDPPDTSALDVIESMIEGRFQKIIRDSAIICQFTFRNPVTMDQLRELINAASGLNYDDDGVHLFTQRVETLSRLFNMREGTSRKDDVLPPRLWEPQANGPRKGMTSAVSKEDFEAQLDKFYTLRGWDKTGKPTKETLELLGLSELAS